jgi:hypothetical protein
LIALAENIIIITRSIIFFLQIGLTARHQHSKRDIFGCSRKEGARRKGRGLFFAPKEQREKECGPDRDDFFAFFFLDKIIEEDFWGVKNI